MIRRVLRAGAALSVAGTLSVSALAAQATVGIGYDYMGYTFDEGLGADAAQLMMMPLAIRLPVSNSLSLDIYSAWAQGQVERDNTKFTLQGVTDTRVKASVQVTPWALVSFGASLPTGNGEHDSQEAIVASVLSTDLFGFREATLGSGFALTSSVATAARIGGWGVGVAGAYSVRDEFSPSSEVALQYQPGNETRVRVGLDRNIGTSTFTAGATFRRYDTDQANGRNLFQAGNRLRFDMTYAFRAGAGVWTLYATDLIRENGDLTLSIVNDVGAQVGDTLVRTAKQNLAVAGVVGTIGLGGGFVFRPHIDFKYQTREEINGSTEGSGWMLSAGGDFPIRVFGGYDFFPKARFRYGAIEDPTGASINVMGAEFTGTLRVSF